MNNTTNAQITHFANKFHVQYIYFLIIPLIVLSSLAIISFLQYHFTKKKNRVENRRPSNTSSGNGRMLAFVPYRLNVPEFLTEFVFNDLNPSKIGRKSNQMNDKHSKDPEDEYHSSDSVIDVDAMTCKDNKDRMDNGNFSSMAPIESHYHKDHTFYAPKGKPVKGGKYLRTKLWM